MVAIICETPFQLMNALNIIYSENEKNCIAFLTENMFLSNRKFTINCDNTYIKQVYKVRRDYKPGILKKVFRKICKQIIGYDYFFLKDTIENFNNYEIIDRIICIKYSNCAFEISKMLRKRKNKNIVIDIIEEGIGEYLVKDGVVNSKKNNLINKIYLLEPDLYKSSENIKIERIPYLNNNKEFLNILNTIFKYRKENNKFKKLIYFGQAFAKDYNIDGFNEIEKCVLETIKKNIEKENIVIKLHPRSDFINIEGLETINTLSPWECNVNELEDIENRVIMSISSTAIITPKLFCNKEPYVICTVKLYERYMKDILKEHNYYNNLIELLTKVKQKYKNKNKFLMPGTIEELEEILIKLRGEKIL